MRPVRLEMRGFAAFREHTVIDFDGLDLFALVGPTGAGKSTIIDGIAFALYGSVARYKSTNLVAPVINQLANEARIRLDFSVGDQLYSATRIVRRTAKGASTKEARLERGASDKDGEVLAGNARELDAAIEELLGLDFDQFTKTVILPQGEFARFLTESAETRQALLRRLLAMERFRTMGTRARERARDTTVKRDALVEQLGDRAPVTDADLSAAQERLDELETLRTDLTAAADAHSMARDREHQLGEELRTAEANVALLKSVKAPTGIAKIRSRITTFENERETARANVEEAATTHQEARDALVKFDSIGDLELRSHQHIDAKRLARELKAATKTSSATAKALAATATVHETATEELQTATIALDDARQRSGVSGLAELLTVGEPCPLCSETVRAIPDHEPHVALAAAQRLFDDAQVASIHASEQHQEAVRDAERASIECDIAAERSDEVAAELAGQPDEATTRKALKEARSRHKTLERAETAERAATEKLRKAETSLAELDDQIATVRRALTDQRDALRALAPPVPEEESITADWDALVVWAGAEATATSATAKSLTVKVKAAAKDTGAAEKAIASLLSGTHTGDSDEDILSDPLSWLAEERGRATAQLASLKQERDAQAATQSRIAELESTAGVAAEMGRLLSSSGFERWLMTDVMHTLADRATERLHELSGGAFSLVTDGTDFSIRDHRNADEIRSARTLSGGETFLASLALALALSENVAELATTGAPQIESMFLDEGFGTLDPETLDVVASAIEELGAQGQMIGVITHVRELAERIPVRFDVTRSPSGAQATRSDVEG